LLQYNSLNQIHILTSGDAYHTSSKRGKSFFSNPSISFFRRFVKIVIDSGLLAKKGKYGNSEWIDSSLRVLKALEDAGVEFDITGLKNITSFEGPAVFISNHMSTMETNILPVLIEPYKDVTFVVKEELLKVPFFGKILKTRNPIVVGRSNPREDFVQVINQGLQILSEGRSIIIFPQRTRSKIFEPESFNSLGIKLAKKAGITIIPVALVTDAWGNGKVFKEFGKIDPFKIVHICFGKPLKIESNGNKEHNEVLNFIKNKLKEWNRQDCLSE
jgi:1-acyl-sn-glycerol-3-phosphate acyltransferase